MKVLFVISSLKKGGAEKIVSNITTHLPEEWEIDILINDDKVIDYPFRGNILSLGIKGRQRMRSVLFQFKLLIKRIKRLKYLKKKGGYQACISFMDSANVACILSGNKYCKNIVNIVNNMSASEQNDLLYRFIVSPLIRLLYNKADKIVAVSEDVKSNMIQEFKIRPDKIVAIYCSIDRQDISRKAKQSIPDDEERWFSQKRTVITAGRLEKQKGQWHLIRAFRKVLEHFPDARLVIFGGGTLEEYLKEMVREYKMEGSVLFIEFSNNLDTYIARSAVFALPSLYEGMSVAVLEAMACGVPCVVADGATGAREQLAPSYQGRIEGYMKGEFGIITEKSSEEMPEFSASLSNSEEAMADAVMEVLRDDEVRKYYAKQAQDRSKVYDIERISMQWTELISGREEE